ncbi:hypothetical protein OVA14_07880 [Agrococcus sp. SL85]|uniref:hypothetical protein n=1 Tax=Agrococcus sp. SL85 TaxID=2995141 RepID=UPI00226D08CD|nr:hypothetical protein [Agrococcus sp. SL85]WAC65301.1 hypothetical protein OVA14_07880 [Agrococcus sp. SL85]
MLQDVSLLDARSIDAFAILAFGLAVLALLGGIAVVTGLRCRALVSETDAIVVGRFGELVLDRRSVVRFENGGTPDIGSMLVRLVERRPPTLHSLEVTLSDGRRIQFVGLSGTHVDVRDLARRMERWRAHGVAAALAPLPRGGRYAR